MNADRQRALLIRIRLCLAVVIAGLVVSGVTAFPLETEVTWLAAQADACCSGSGLAVWLGRVAHALHETNVRHPFLAYGTDWLAYAHLVIALAYLGPWRDPVRNVWVIQWGLLCCATIPVLAFVAGSARGLPTYWMLIDTLFGVFAAPPLALAWQSVRQLEREQRADAGSRDAAISGSGRRSG